MNYKLPVDSKETIDSVKACATEAANLEIRLRGGRGDPAGSLTDGFSEWWSALVKDLRLIEANVVRDIARKAWNDAIGDRDCLPAIVTVSRVANMIGIFKSSALIFADLLGIPLAPGKTARMYAADARRLIRAISTGDAQRASDMARVARRKA